jgi:hypothetical protein
LTNSRHFSRLNFDLNIFNSPSTVKGEHMAESDLYLPVKRFLEVQGYTVKGEIKECDIVAVRGNEAPVIVELKVAFSLQLLMQGVDRQAISDAVYLAITPPKRRQYHDMLKLCRRLGLGVLIVTGDHVEALADPAPYQPRKANKRKTQLLKEFAHRTGDTTLGGSSTRALRMTAYRQDTLRCAAYLSQKGASKVALITAEAGVAKAAAILQRDVYGWFFKVDRGIYTLSVKGNAALVTFAGALEDMQSLKTLSDKTCL